jgi:transposase
MAGRRHAPEIRERALQLVANGEKQVDIAAKIGVPGQTISSWVLKAGSLGRMTGSEKIDERFTSKEKQRILRVASALSEVELGAFLRKEGVGEAQLKQWQAAVDAVLERPKRRRKTDKEKELERRNKQLERELRRKEKALAEAAALLVLKKKVEEIWGEEDDDTNGTSD